jgi:methionyl-tRNA formyltransferase
MSRLDRLVFFGTPLFALPTLEALIRAGRPPDLVVTQPARPAGRGRELKASPVALLAGERGLDVLQPERVASAPFLERLARLRPQVAVVVAFGQIFRSELLALPTLGCVNLHASLLPRYRGAAPIQAAIAAGDDVTGVTTMLMEEGLDSGPILLQRRVSIGRRETSGELAPRLAAEGADLMLDTLAALEAGSVEPRPQDESQVSLAPRLRREDGLIDWHRPAREIYNRLRAFSPWPGIHSTVSGRPVKILEAEPLERGEGDLPPGTIAGLEERVLVVVCGGGSRLAIGRLQRPGKKPLPASDFWHGERLEAGDRFGGVPS